ncbi:unnamed protein product, partial [Rotaria sp. Silwood1]
RKITPMSNQSPANFVTGLLDATKPVVKFGAIVEGAVITVVTGNKNAIPELCKTVDQVFDELKK